MKRLVFTVIAVVVLFTSSLFARIINIPAEYQTIQAGINASVNGDTVLVQPGTYVEYLIIDFKSICLASLFLISNDSSHISTTVIDGNSAGTVMALRYCDSTMMVKGFTIKRGRGNSGGGIYCYMSQPLIANNYIKNNLASSKGAAIYCYYSYPRIFHNIIADNITDPAGNGGGILCENSNVIILENKIIGNYAGNGGGVGCVRCSSTTISDNLISDNNVNGSGAGIYCYSGNLYNPQIFRNIIKNNRASNGQGGGISCAIINPNIEENVIENNYAHSNAGIDCSDHSNSIIINNLIRGNIAVTGAGGIAIGYHADCYMLNNTIVENIGDYAGGVGLYETNSQLVNNIIWNNSSPQLNEYEIASVKYCDIQDGYPGIGNINNDPLFVNPPFDYTTCKYSICINNGDPNRIDPDSTRSDIGQYFTNHQICLVGNSWYVSINGNDSLGAGNEQSPFRTIQHTINSSIDNDKIIVNPGIYYENISITGKNIQLCSKHLMDNNHDLAPAVIDGDSAGSCLTILGCDSTTIVRGFTIQHGRAINGGGINIINSNVLIEDCTLKNNFADSNGGAFYTRACSPIINKCLMDNNTANCNGGALYCYLASPTIENNTIQNNYCALNGSGISVSSSSNPIIVGNNLENNAGARYGGGISCEYMSNPLITNNQISENRALYAAGIFIHSAYLNIVQNEITYNYASRTGGGIYSVGGRIITNNYIAYNNAAISAGGVLASANTILTKNIICHNNSVDGGGIMIGFEGGATIDCNSIFNNSATNRGGGMFCNQSSLIKDNAIYNNFASSGGGIYGQGISNRLNNNKIINNHASNKGGGIGFGDNYLVYGQYGLYLFSDSICGNTADSAGGGIYLYKTNIELNHAVIYQNNSQYGGGIYSNKSGNNFYYSQILENSSLFGGALYATKRSSLLMSNSTISGNSADSVGGGFYFSDTSNTLIKNSIFWGDSSASTPEFYKDSSSSVVMNYCDIAGGWPGVGNIDIDPLFRNPSRGDFHLMAVACGDSIDSPCIDAGAPYLSDTIMSCAWGLGTTRSDMGAYGGGIGQIDIDDNEPALPERVSLSQNYPNPFNSNTVISFELPEASKVSIEIFDILGRKVQTLIDEYKPAGRHQVTWQPGNSSSGIYFYSLKTENYSEIKKMLLIK